MPTIVVSLTFDSPSLAEGERLRRRLRDAARRAAKESRLVESSYSTPTTAGTAEDVDE